ncbi:MAG: L,D-transpeptidase, partial [Spirochaetales bacterium]|nr:L,D-transpeptidase [Spirochaetales bacterium]
DNIIFRKEFKDGSAILDDYEKKYGIITCDADIRIFNERNPSTPLLRGFGIHGGGYIPGFDWTIGCPAMANDDVIDLYNLIRQNPDSGIGTEVIIQD